MGRFCQRFFWRGGRSFWLADCRIEAERLHPLEFMPAKDFYHDTVKTALIKDGWTVADKSLTFMVGKRPLMVDIAAEKVLIAERNTQKIAVEVKSFLSPSPMTDLEKALGQFMLYFDIMAEQDPDRTLYLAVPQAT
jgi:XisH protein